MPLGVVVHPLALAAKGNLYFSVDAPVSLARRATRRRSATAAADVGSIGSHWARRLVCNGRHEPK